MEPALTPPVPVSPEVSVIGVGSGFPVERSVTAGEPEISVNGGLSGSADGMNSVTVPPTWTRLPTAAVAGGALEVKTKMPSEVFVLASIVASGS